MYLKKIVLRNIKCFTEFELDFTKDKGFRLWTALLGQNGLGKSTLLQAIGVALAGPTAVRELLPVAEGWVRAGKPFGEIEAELVWSEGDASPPVRPKKKSPYLARYVVTGNDPSLLPDVLKEYSAVPTIASWSGEGTRKERENLTKDMNRLKQTAYAEGKEGWLGCGYGPFRRLSGGGQDADRILYGKRKSARFVTLFREDAALTNSKNWLIELYNTARDGDQKQAHALEQVKAAFSENLFPQPATLEITARDALLKIGDKTPVRFEDLSDGYRSMLSLAIDLLRWLIAAFPDIDDPMKAPGVVLIDELDAHAHPTWQRTIGDWLREKFPLIQFIIATHSPFLAQVADEQGGNVVLEDMGLFGVRPRSDVEVVETWRVDQILTELFDLPTTYKPKVEALLKRHQELHLKKQSLPLHEAERKEYVQLDLWRTEHIPPALEDPDQRRISQALRESVEKHSTKLKELS